MEGTNHKDTKATKNTKEDAIRAGEAIGSPLLCFLSFLIFAVFVAFVSLWFVPTRNPKSEIRNPKSIPYLRFHQTMAPSIMAARGSA